MESMAKSRMFGLVFKNLPKQRRGILNQRRLSITHARTPNKELNMRREKLAKMLIAASLATSVTGLAVAQQQRQRPGGGQGSGQGQGQQRPGGGGGDSGEGQRPPRPDADKCFDRADSNQDGELSRAEFKTWFNNRPPPPPRDGDGGERRPPPPRDE
jgi:hypothetical protein